MTKRFLSILLTLCMMLTLIPMTVWADENEHNSGISDNHLEDKINSADDNSNEESTTGRETDNTNEESTSVRETDSNNDETTNTPVTDNGNYESTEKNAPENGTGKKDDVPKTGDSTPILWLSILVAISGTGLILFGKKGYGH